MPSSQHTLLSGQMKRGLSVVLVLILRWFCLFVVCFYYSKTVWVAFCCCGVTWSIPQCQMERKLARGDGKKKLLSDKKDKGENAGTNSYCQRTVQNSKQTHNYLDSRVLSSLKPEKITAAIPALGLAWLSKKIMNVEVLCKLVKRDTIHMEQIPTIIPSQKVGEGGRTRQYAHFCCLFQLLLTAPNSHSPPHTSSAMALSMSVSTCEGWNPQR